MHEAEANPIPETAELAGRGARFLAKCLDNLIADTRVVRAQRTTSADDPGRSISQSIAPAL